MEYLNVKRLVLNLNLPLLENKVLAHNPLPDILYVFNHSLKVGCSVI
jgi:hypothetical protein